MQSIYYFTPFTFFSQPLCLPLMFQPTPNGSVMVLQESSLNSTERENQQNNSLAACRNQITERETEELRASAECKSIGKSSKIGRIFYGKQSDDEFKLRTNPSNGVVYKKKNTESNIINQVFSYLCTNKSKNSVLSFFNKDEQKANSFYVIMQKIKKNNKKYINRKFIKKLIECKGDLLLEKAVSKVKANCVQISELRRLLRVLIFRFLREDANVTLLTSSKIYKSTLSEHFWRKRQVLFFLFGKEGAQI